MPFLVALLSMYMYNLFIRFLLPRGDPTSFVWKGEVPPPPPQKKIPPFISLVKESVIFNFKLQFCILNMFPALFCLHCT